MASQYELDCFLSPSLSRLYRQGFCLCNVLSLTDLLDCDDFRTDGFYVHQYQFMDKARKLETSMVTL